MKRAALFDLKRENETLKFLKTCYFATLKDRYKDIWTFSVEDDAFYNKDNKSLVEAYVLNGIVYDGRTRKPFQMKALKSDAVDRVPKDIWIMILRYLKPHELIVLEMTCVKIAKAAAVLWKEYGKLMSQRFGPVFCQILRHQNMTYQDFFHLWKRSVWVKEWLPFEILFAAPPGTAVKYHPDRKKQFIADGEFSIASDSGVIEFQDGRCSGYFRKPKLRKGRGIYFYGHRIAKESREIERHSNGCWSCNTTMERHFKNNPFSFESEYSSSFFT